LAGLQEFSVLSHALGSSGRLFPSLEALERASGPRQSSIDSTDEVAAQEVCCVSLCPGGEGRLHPVGEGSPVLVSALYGVREHFGLRDLFLEAQRLL